MKSSFVLAGVLFSVSASATMFAESRFESFYNAIVEQKITSIDEALGLLPESLLSSYTLIKRSQSLQGASLEKPRVILMGDRAEFVVAFNAEGMRGSDVLETAEYDWANEDVVFRSIKFAEGKVVASQPNPSQCKTCHGEDPTYIWDNYRNWQGQYAESDDKLPPEELRPLRKFNSEASTTRRYRHLIMEEETANHLYPYHKQDAGRYFSHMPGFRLSSYLARWNVRRLVKILREHPDYDRYKKLLLASTWYCKIRDHLTVQESNKLKSTLNISNTWDIDIHAGISNKLEIPLQRGWSLKQGDYYVPYGESSFETHGMVAWWIFQDVDLGEFESQKPKLSRSAQSVYSGGQNPIVAPEYSLRMDEISLSTASKELGRHPGICKKLVEDGVAEVLRAASI